jgi:nuclease S1
MSGRSIGALVAAMVLTARAGGAWAPVGHQIVGEIADSRLSPAARTRIDALLGTGATLASVANWADEVKRETKTERWHYVDIPLAETKYDAARDCKTKETGDCAVAAIARERAILADASQPAAKRAEAVKFIVHLIGDIHQPLHDADNGDRGGTDVVVWLRHEPTGEPIETTLHEVWDGGILIEVGLGLSAEVDRIRSWLGTQDASVIEAGDVIAWVEAGHRMARSQVYASLPANHHLPADYAPKHIGVVREQLGKAGVRLAMILNDALRGQ